MFGLRLPLILVVLFSVVIAPQAYGQASCRPTNAVYTMAASPGWELRLPMPVNGRSLMELDTVPMVSLYSTDKKKTYEFGWIFSNGTLAQYLTPLWIKNPSGKAYLRIHHFEKGELMNGLPSPDDDAPEGMFIEDFDVFFRYSVDSMEDQDFTGIGLWKFKSCDR